MSARQDSSSAQVLLDKFDQVRERLAEIERKKARIEERQDRIDSLAIRTLCAMNHLHGRIQTYRSVYDLDKELVSRSRSAREEDFIYLAEQGVQTDDVVVEAKGPSNHDDGNDDDDESCDTFASESLGKYESDYPQKHCEAKKAT